MDTFVLDVKDIFELSDAQFYQLCRQHPDIRFERSADGELIIMPPTVGITGLQSFNLTGQVGMWVEQHPELGVGFALPLVLNCPMEPIVRRMWHG